MCSSSRGAWHIAPDSHEASPTTDERMNEWLCNFVLSKYIAVVLLCVRAPYDNNMISPAPRTAVKDLSLIHI